MLNGLDLFSGIGGLATALEPWVLPVAYCEKDRYAQAVLLSRMHDRSLPSAPIWDDVQTLNGTHIPSVDIISGGFPCQDISTAGNGIGLEGKRSGLFFEIIRLCSDLRPRFVFLENVPAITVRGLDRVCLEFTSIGYDCRWTIVSAASVGADHRRERWWLLAHANCEPSWNQRQDLVRTNSKLDQSEADTRNNCEKEYLANSSGERLTKTRRLRSDESKKRTSSRGKEMAYSKSFGLETKHCFGFGNESKQSFTWRDSLSDGRGYWAVEPNVGRVVNGLPHRVDRIRGLGNAVVPLQAREAFKKLIGELK